MLRGRRRALRSALLAAPAAAIALLVLPSTSSAVAPAAIEHRNVVVCPTPPRGYAHCHLVLHQAVTPNRKPAPSATSPSGYGPDDLMAAYDWGSVASPAIGTGSGETIAVVDAYDDPTIASDLAAFSNQYSLPPCTSQNGCFTKVDQQGGSNYPSKNAGWALEISLDVEWAHAIAPGARILLVEASSASFSNLMAAEDYASANAQVVTNSWGGSEFSGESSYDTHFAESHPGVAYFASAGDTGGVVEYPSASPGVISVGGTTLSDTTSGWTETGWSGSGGGCSAYEAANPAQVTGSVNCGGKRATPDVASDANPNTGLAVYDSTSYYGQSGWFEVGGTSAAAPVWAARAADEMAPVGSGLVDASYLYAGYPTTTNLTFRDITQGNNGYPAGLGYDLVTGLGSWLGVGSSSGGSSTGGSGGSGGSGGGTTSQPLTLTVAPGGETTRGPHHQVPITVTAISSTSAVAGASVALQVYAVGSSTSVCSNLTGKPVAQGSGTTASDGTVTFTFSTKSTGTWCAAAQASATGYTSTTGASDPFST